MGYSYKAHDSACKMIVSSLTRLIFLARKSKDNKRFRLIKPRQKVILCHWTGFGTRIRKQANMAKNTWMVNNDAEIIELVKGGKVMY